MNSMKITAEEKQRLPFVLHLSMDLNPGEYKDVAEALREYGSCSNGRYFTRDIVVPGDITLYALHYAIQRLYGFTNSHTRKFMIPEERIIELSGNSIRKLFEFYGVFLQIPYQDSPTGIPPYYYLDDYDDEDISIRSWLKQKYTGPYLKNPKEESYLHQQKKAKELLRTAKENYDIYGLDTESATAEEFFRHPLSVNADSLLLRLPVAEVIAPEGTALLNADEWNTQSNSDDFEYLTKVINYEYDTGDGWEVEITRPDDIQFSDKVFRKVMETHCPVCIASDGFYLVDDVGGIDGYTDFIRCVFGGIMEEYSNFESPDDAYAWAHYTFEWSKVKPPLKNML